MKTPTSLLSPIYAYLYAHFSYIFFCVSFIVCLLSSSASVFAINSNDIIFNEIAWAGSSVSGATDEWIELRNMTDSDINLSGFSITRWRSTGGGSEQTLLIFLSGNVIPAHGFFLISERDISDGDISALQISPDVKNNMVLHDTSFQLKLYDNNQNIIDIAGDKGSPLRGYNSGGIKSSMSRIPDNSSDGTVKESWFTSQLSFQLNNPDENFGSPANSSTSFVNAFPEVVYEDGEDDDVNGWTIYDNNPATATISTSAGSVLINGEVMQKYYFSEYSSSAQADPSNGTAVKLAGLQNTTHFNASFSFTTTDEKFTIYIRVKTKNNGFRYLEYTPGDVSWLGQDYSSNHSWIGDDDYIHHYLGVDANDGNWHTIYRNLQDDLSDGNAGEEIEYVEGFYVRMTGKVDNLKLLTE